MRLPRCLSILVLVACQGSEPTSPASEIPPDDTDDTVSELDCTPPVYAADLTLDPAVIQLPGPGHRAVSLGDAAAFDGTDQLAVATREGQLILLDVSPDNAPTILDSVAIPPAFDLAFGDDLWLAAGEAGAGSQIQRYDADGDHVSSMTRRDSPS